MYYDKYEQYTDSMYKRLMDCHRQIYEAQRERERIEQLKREIIQEIKEPLIGEVLERIRIEFVDDASPSIKALREQIDSLFKR